MSAELARGLAALEAERFAPNPAPRRCPHHSAVTIGARRAMTLRCELQGRHAGQHLAAVQYVPNRGEALVWLTVRWS